MNGWDDPDQTDERRDDDVLDALIARVDLDGLVRLVDDRCSSRDWPGLLLLRDRCRAATLTGRQLWPAATLAEYRLALLAPPEWAATVIDEESGRFTIGPLSEVVAQHHTFADLWPFLPAGPRAGFVAHERVLRGEIIDPAITALLTDVLELPYELQSWEPMYEVAEYGDVDMTAPSPAPADRRGAVTVAVPDTAVPLDRDDLFPVRNAARQLLEGWTVGSNGRATVVGVDGGPADALRALGASRGTVVRISGADALAWLAWAGASGGARGRRRGAAVGRFGAWWTAAAIVGLDLADGDTLADVADDLGELIDEWNWFWFDAGEPDLGWSLQVMAFEPNENITFAISAHDAP